MYMTLFEAIVWRQILIIAIIALVVSTLVLKIASTLGFAKDSKLASFIGTVAGFSVIFFLNVLEDSTLIIAGVISAVVSLIAGLIASSMLDSGTDQRGGVALGHKMGRTAEKIDENDIYNIINNPDRKDRINRLFNIQASYDIFIDTPLDVKDVFLPFRNHADFMQNNEDYERIRVEFEEEGNDITIAYAIPGTGVRLSAHNHSSGVLRVDMLVFPPTAFTPEEAQLLNEQYDFIKADQAILIDDVLTFVMGTLKELCHCDSIKVMFSQSGDTTLVNIPVNAPTSTQTGLTTGTAAATPDRARALKPTSPQTMAETVLADFCNQCGRKNNDNLKFCSNCGKSLTRG